MSDSTHPPAMVISPRRLRLVALIAVLILTAIVVIGIATRVANARQLKTWTAAQTVPTVNAALPQRSVGSTPLALPGRIEAYARAPIYARVSGYLKSWKADIGTHVKAGQLLAVIETPDLDQQLLQARADLASAEADAALASTTAKRWQAMLSSDSVSRQEVDQKTGDFIAKQARAKAAMANVHRIEAMKSYARIVAPFDGVVTARNTDVGALINAGSAGQELFVVSDVRKLRVYVQVPQRDVPSIVHGATATLNVPGYTGQAFTASVVASAGAVTASSGTALIQLAVDNADGKLMPGSFANVIFHLPADKAALRVPASALVFDGKGLHLATVGADDRVMFKNVTLARDDGRSVEIASGLVASDRVIDSPPDGLANGDRVKIATPRSPAKPHAKA